MPFKTKEGELVRPQIFKNWEGEDIAVVSPLEVNPENQVRVAIIHPDYVAHTDSKKPKVIEPRPIFDEEMYGVVSREGFHFVDTRTGQVEGKVIFEEKRK
jgi:hypothetical protein